MKAWDCMRVGFPLLLLTLVAGCVGGGTGGGGGSGHGYGSGDDTAPVRDVGTEIRIREAVATLRTGNGLPVLVEDPRLEAVARAQATYCLRVGDLRHRDGDGGDVGDRLGAAGIDFREAGEILGRDRLSADPAESLFREWMRSPGHRRELMHPGFTRMGIAVVERDGVVYAAMVFLNP